MFLFIKSVLFCSVIMVASFGSRRSVLLAIALLIPFPLMNILPFSASVGLTGVMLVCVIVSLRFVIEVFLSRKIIFFGSYSKEFLGVLSFLWLWTVLGALTLPVVFSGFQVVSGAGEHQSLDLNISHAAQVIYITIYFLLVLWSCGVSSPGVVVKEQSGDQLLGSDLLLICLVMAGLFSSYQLLSIASGLPYVSDFIYDMPRRAGIEQAVVSGLVPRINGSFAEASDAGRFYSAMIAAFLMACYCGLQRRFIVPTIIALVFILLTFSSTAIVATCLLLTFWGLNCSRSFLSVRLKSLSAVVLIIAALLLAGFGVLEIVDLTLSELIYVIQHLTIGKVETNSFESRFTIDFIAMQLAVESNFFGVGLGSHRSSSFITFIISNLGLPGFLMFVYIGLRIFVLPKRFRTSENVILSAAIFGFVLAKSIAGPDLSDDFLWFLVALWVRQICCTERRLSA